MVRARPGKATKRGRKRLRKLTKGFRLSRHNLYKQAVVTLMRARCFAYRDRRVRKREFRKLWICRINAACRMRGIRYSQMIRGLMEANVILNRKMLSEIAIHDPDTFTKLVEIAKQNLPEGLKTGFREPAIA
ncbi:MAG: 50S ribosomal protein L20 [Gemmataceae bacterium]